MKNLAASYRLGSRANLKVHARSYSGHGNRKQELVFQRIALVNFYYYHFLEPRLIKRSCNCTVHTLSKTKRSG